MPAIPRLCLVALVALVAACASSDAPDPGAGLELTLLEPPPPESDRLPEYAMAHDGIALGTAIDAVLDDSTRTLAWIDPAGTLWIAPLATAPADRHAIAQDVLPGLAVSRGRLAFAARIDGPESAPFVADLRTRQVLALEDAPGPDEIIGFSPDGDELLLLSGRTGLASLFAIGIDQPTARQLTNIGLRPGPSLDHTAVTPAPAHRRDVAWVANGITYRAGAEMVRLPAAEVAR
ncbi:MAG TPA: hypothetical protein VML75_15300 [Kofleriaceae bacterium]|nr:hypothetical protein [Kofleriaceae bacterium]